MDIHITIYQLLCLIGVPSFITTINVWVFKKTKENHVRHESLELGVQALLRSQMIADYNLWNERGYAPIYAKDNFENCWEQYHNLGANGVMDKLHEDFMKLPINPPKDKE